jgi:serine/threonine protein kinase
MEQETTSYNISNLNNKKSIDDFLTVVVLGRGSYAKVVLVKEKDTKQIFAMKILKKKHIEKRKQEEHVRIKKKRRI